MLSGETQGDLPDMTGVPRRGHIDDLFGSTASGNLPCKVCAIAESRERRGFDAPVSDR